LAEQSSLSTPYYFASSVFYYYDRVTRARELLDAALEDARRRGSPSGVSQAGAWRSWAALYGGSLADGEADARLVLDLTAEHGETFLSRASAPAVLALVRLERGQAADALAELERRRLGGAVPEAGPWNLLLFVRGRCRAALGDLAGALLDTLAAGRALLGNDVTTPAGVPWRSQAGILEMALGQVEQGRARIEEELSLARALGVPRVLGIALMARAGVDQGEQRQAWLEQAVQVLRDSEARLDLARALLALGAELRRSGQPRAAREPLSEGLALADELGASACGQQAREELLLTEARPRRAARHGPDALTAAELRVARAAAAGASNREIADEFFLSLTPVETHLTRVYQKLDIRGRRDLATALGLGTDASSSRRG
jgi:DNA-binding CsgD family transcriptional regulator